ncbi:hypothetical protein [Prescottella subtropica]|uniref:hypothetical protein n=1 Tax=Prescottella subtropica TaxID=2545757 RepID=UPI0013867CEF|nr:hypothetical protein [Prescottella subtropica]
MREHTPTTLDDLHRMLTSLVPDGPAASSRSAGFRSALTSARIFVLDERARA